MSPVTRRKVFYIPGYDPIHPRRYRELYRSEGAAQAAVSGYDIALKPKKTKGGYGWRVISCQDGQQVEAEVEVLVWSDIVRSSMSNSIPATYAQLARTAWAYIGSGALGRLMKLRKGPVIAALYPVVFLLVQAALALALVALFGWGGAQLLGPGPGLVAGISVGLLAGWGLLDWFRRRDGRFFAYYLMHDYAWSAQHGGAYPPELEPRLAAFAGQIAGALDSDVDEVLVVGHSSGAYLAVSVLADLLRAGRLPAGGPALALLTLGQVVPMVSFLPRAERLRGDLRYLSESGGITWVDVTAPGDGCAFALCDPVAVSGVATEAKRWPLVFSARFTQSLSPQRWQELRWKFFRLHFQYLCAFDVPLDYDYFRITAGPQTLAQRYAGRAPSASRIETPVNRHTSVGP